MTPGRIVEPLDVVEHICFGFRPGDVVLNTFSYHHPELGRLRLIITREDETDVMTLKCECGAPGEALRGEVAATLHAVAKLSGTVAWAAPQSLPNDGKVIADERKPA